MAFELNILKILAPLPGLALISECFDQGGWLRPCKGL